MFITNVNGTSFNSGPNSDEKCTPGDTKPAGDGCNNYICTNDGIWGAITLVGCFRPGVIYWFNSSKYVDTITWFNVWNLKKESFI